MVKAAVIIAALFSTMASAAVIDPNSDVSVTEKRDYSGYGEYFRALPPNSWLLCLTQALKAPTTRLACS